MLALRHLFLLLAVAAFAGVVTYGPIEAAEGEKPIKRDYSRVTAPPAPARQSFEEMMGKSEGCLSCHVSTDAPTMHLTPAVQLGCTDCHGGDVSVVGDSQLPNDHPDYVAARDLAHVLPKYPESWH